MERCFLCPARGTAGLTSSLATLPEADFARAIALGLAAFAITDNLFSMRPVLLSHGSAVPLKTAEQLRADLDFQRSGRLLPLGVPALDDALPQGGLPYGNVVELQVHGASGAATSFALCACRAARVRAGSGTEPGNGWSAFIDPSRTLFAPGVAQLGIDLERLLVIRPELKSVERVAVRIAEAKVASVIVIDLRGAMAELTCDIRRWQSAVRRLSLAIQQLPTCVLMITPTQAGRHSPNVSPSMAPLSIAPLPVAMRLEFTRLSAETFEIRIGKERTGRTSPPRTINWSTFALHAVTCPADTFPRERRSHSPSETSRLTSRSCGERAWRADSLARNDAQALARSSASAETRATA